MTFISGAAVQAIQFFGIAHGHDAHAISAIVGLNHYKRFLAMPIFLVLFADLAQQRVHIGLQAFHAGAFGKIYLATTVEQRVNEPRIHAQQLAKAFGHFL